MALSGFIERLTSKNTYLCLICSSYHFDGGTNASFSLAGSSFIGYLPPFFGGYFEAVVVVGA
jgi:hypothetical protein